MAIIYDIRINQNFGKNEPKEEYKDPTIINFNYNNIDIPGVDSIHPKWLCDIAFTWLEMSKAKNWPIEDQLGNRAEDPQVYYKNIQARLADLVE